MARQRRIVGAVLRVAFAPGWHTYALTLTDAEFAFFDAATQTELKAEEAVTRPVLFRWCVATPEECEGLEPAAVWEPEHAEARLRNHYAELLSGAVEFGDAL